MTDYNYQGKHINLTDDRGQNAATDLSHTTYPVEPQLDSDWPGTEANPNVQRVDTAAMRRIAHEIDKLTEPLRGNGAGTPANITQVAAKARYGPDKWDAARFLGTATTQAAQAISEFGQKLIQNLDAAQKAIKTAADHYDGTESANDREIRQQQSNLPGSSHNYYG